MSFVALTALTFLGIKECGGEATLGEGGGDAGGGDGINVIQVLISSGFKPRVLKISSPGFEAGSVAKYLCASVEFKLLKDLTVVLSSLLKLSRGV